jgi:GNAT superfamily N-acetyltransferase
MVAVRLIEPGDDLERAGEIVRAAYFALPGYPRDPEYDVEIGDVAARVADDDVAVALLDGRIVGCLTYVGPASPHHEFDDPQAASFRFFGVDPAVQGAGVGEAMVDWCIARAREQGWARLRIHTLASMPAAQRLYLRKGFLPDPDNDEDWDGIIGHAFVMHL